MIKIVKINLARIEPNQVQTGTVAHKAADIAGVRITSGIDLRTGRRVILYLAFLSGWYSVDETPQSWTWKNYARIKQWEAELNGETVAPELVI